MSDLRGDVWLGDVLRAARALAADAAAIGAIVRLLALDGGRAGSDATDMARGGVPAGDAGHAAPATEATTALPAPAGPVDGPGEAEDHRLPSRVEALVRSAAVPPPGWSDVAPLRPRPAPERPRAPLLPRQRRRALLSALLAGVVADGEPDIERIVAELACGRPIARLPRRSRRTLRRGVELRIDQAAWLRPFASDQAELGAYLRQLMPRDRVCVRVIQGGPEPLPPSVRRWREAAGQPALPQSPMLLLSDLGAGYRPQSQAPASRAQWQALAADNRRQGRRTIALTPIRPAPAQRVAGVEIVPWSERTSLADIACARNGQAPAAWPGEIDVLPLARLVSPALRVTPWLLRQARIECLPQLGPEVEAELWFSEFVQSSSDDGLVLDPEAARMLRGELDAATLETALGLVARSRSGAADVTAIEDALVALELRGTLTDATAEAVLRATLKALAAPVQRGAEDDPARAVASWAAHAWTRFSPAVRRTRAARQLAFAAARHLAGRAWLVAADGQRPALPDGSGWLFEGDDGPRTAFCIELRRYGDGSTNLVIGPAQAQTNALHRIELPAAEPVWIEVEQVFADDRAPQRQTLAVDARGPTQIDVGRVSPNAHIDVLPLAGPAYRVWQPASAAEVLRGVLWRGVVSASSGGSPWEWHVTAVVVDARRALLPIASADKNLREVDLEGQARRLSLVSTDGASPVEVRVIGRLQRAGFDAWVVQREVGAGAAPDDGWRPLDAQLLPELGLPDEITDVLVPLAAHLDLEPIGLVREDSLRFRAPQERLLAATPALRASVREGRWQVVVEASIGPEVSALPGYDWAEIQRDVAALRSTDETLFLLIGEPGREKLAFRLWDETVSRLGAGRVRFDHDGRVLGHIDAVLDEIDGVLILGDADPARWLPEPVHTAIVAGKPLLWLTAHDAPGNLLSGWEPAMSAAASRERPFWQRPQAIERGRSEDDAAIAVFLARIEAWRPRVPFELAAESRSAATPPAPPRSFGTSLRARFASFVERREDNDIGLFRVELQPGRGMTLTRADWPRDGLPALLFIHGELADTEANFGELLHDPNAERERLVERYGERIFAWRWRSVTVAPLPNALELARVLAGGNVHIVSLGAGGFLPELLCAVNQHQGADLQALNWNWSDPASPEYINPKQLDALAQIVNNREPPLRIERFVRVACPGAGTSLYGRGVDRGLNVAKMLPYIGTALALLPGMDTLFGDPLASPGLTALAPGAGVQPLLATSARTDAPLTVVAGVAEGGGLLVRLGRAVLNTTRGDARSDLVVPLASAFAGLERSGGVDWVVDVGPDSTHFNFFRNPGTRRAIVDALLASQRPPTGFRHAATLSEAQRTIR